MAPKCDDVNVIPGVKKPSQSYQEVKMPLIDIPLNEQQIETPVKQDTNISEVNLDTTNSADTLQRSVSSEHACKIPLFTA